MTELRRRLDRLRAAHRAARYPGDLTVDVMSPISGAAPCRWWPAVAAGGVIAAAITLAIVLRSSHDPTAAPRPQAAVTLGISFSIADAASFPAGGSVVPVYQPVTPPPIPSMPSWSELQQQSLNIPQEVP